MIQPDYRLATGVSRRLGQVNRYTHTETGEHPMNNIVAEWPGNNDNGNNNANDNNGNDLNNAV